MAFATILERKKSFVLRSQTLFIHNGLKKNKPRKNTVCCWLVPVLFCVLCSLIERILVYPEILTKNKLIGLLLNIDTPPQPNS